MIDAATIRHGRSAIDLTLKALTYLPPFIHTLPNPSGVCCQPWKAQSGEIGEDIGGREAVLCSFASARSVCYKGVGTTNVSERRPNGTCSINIIIIPYVASNCSFFEELL